jgi:UTP--glucose-1-phosphate uridylyltransferase
MVKQAIIPLAGLGTRLLPLSSVIPKELLPINGKSNLEYILEECIESGIRQFIFVVPKNRPSIKKYFFNDNFYKKIIKKKKNDKRLKQVFKRIKRYQKMIKFVYQNKPEGTGQAVLKCKKYIKGSHFLMLLADDLIVKKNCSKEMIALHKRTRGSVIATKKVERKTVSRWGILGFKNRSKNSFLINEVIEKPKLSESPSNYAIIGRYILPKKILSVLKNQGKGKGGEIHITDAIKTLVKRNEKFYGNIFKGKYIDCGTLEGFIKSSITVSKYL